MICNNNCSIDNWNNNDKAHIIKDVADNKHYFLKLEKYSSFQKHNPDYYYVIFVKSFRKIWTSNITWTFTTFSTLISAIHQDHPHWKNILPAKDLNIPHNIRNMN